MTAPYDPTSGYQPSGGWGYHDWGQAGAEAWDNADQATANGDPTTASHWTELAQQADQQSHDVYVAGGPGYGTGGDSSGSDDGTYWGQGAVPAADTAPTYDAAPPYDAAPSYETPAADTGTDTSSGLQLDLHTDHSTADLGL